MATKPLAERLRDPKTWFSIVVFVLACAVWFYGQARSEDTNDAGGTQEPTSLASAQGSPTGASSPQASASITARPSPPPSRPSTSAPSSAPSSAPTGAVEPETSRDPMSGLYWIGEDDLPDEALDTLDAIEDGGPFVRDKDGSTFGNYEGVLPPRSRGYYREYTVPTPGVDHAGARRIVTGENDEFYWTEDHYDTFERIRR